MKQTHKQILEEPPRSRAAPAINHGRIGFMVRAGYSGMATTIRTRHHSGGSEKPAHPPIDALRQKQGGGPILPSFQSPGARWVKTFGERELGPWVALPRRRTAGATSKHFGRFLECRERRHGGGGAAFSFSHPLPLLCPGIGEKGSLFPQGQSGLGLFRSLMLMQ